MDRAARPAAPPDRRSCSDGCLRLQDTRDPRPGPLGGPPVPCPAPSVICSSFTRTLPGTRFAARPSGTEPKIKFYLFARTQVAGPDYLAAAKVETKQRLERMASDLEQYLDDVLKSTA